MFLLALIISLIFISDRYVSWQAAPYLYADIDNLPDNQIALVLGTSKYVKGGRVNLFFKYRMDAAAELFRSGKIRHILISGDNSIKQYNETREMYRALLDRGVPKDAITLDYAGFRTLDSVIRAQKVFGQNKFTIISQKFHNQRAMFIAKANGIDAIAFNAQEVSRRTSPKTYFREYFARVKALLDVYVLNTQPKFLGEPIEIAI